MNAATSLHASGLFIYPFVGVVGGLVCESVGKAVCRQPILIASCPVLTTWASSITPHSPTTFAIRSIKGGETDPVRSGP